MQEKLELIKDDKGEFKKNLHQGVPFIYDYQVKFSDGKGFEKTFDLKADIRKVDTADKALQKAKYDTNFEQRPAFGSTTDYTPEQMAMLIALEKEKIELGNRQALANEGIFTEEELGISELKENIRQMHIEGLDAGLKILSVNIKR